MKKTLCILLILLFLPWGLAACKKTEQREKFIYYRDFGAMGDGVTDDSSALAAAHEQANALGRRVIAEEDAVYYIGGNDVTISIKTSTDWGNAEFKIDDGNVQNRNGWVFEVESALEAVPLNTVTSVTRANQWIGTSLEQPSVVVLTDNNTRRYIRMGANANNGNAQTDVVLADKNGKISEETPLLWDFNSITSITAHPIDSTTLNITGGVFTTIANDGAQGVNYYSRAIRVSRSNTIIDGLTHYVVGEGAKGSPYRGIIYVENCANVTIKNSTFTGHKGYPNEAGTATQGSYDLNANRAINLRVENCGQTNSIDNNEYWGIFSSNYSKNIVFDGVEFSRFDAHQGVHNASILNSTLGHQGISIIGSGLLHIENSQIRARNLVSLREDYGSSWDGDILIENCVFSPTNNDAIVIGGANLGQHNFGYSCTMPERIIINKLTINDSNHPPSYTGAKILAEFNASYTGLEPFSYAITKEIHIKELVALSGKAYRISVNTKMFQNVALK